MFDKIIGFNWSIGHPNEPLYTEIVCLCHKRVCSTVEHQNYLVTYLADPLGKNTFDKLRN